MSYKIYIVYNPDKDGPVVATTDFALKSIYNRYGVSFETEVIDNRSQPQMDRLKSDLGGNYNWKGPELFLVRTDLKRAVASLSLQRHKYEVKIPPDELVALPNPREAENKLIQAFYLGEMVKVLDKFNLIPTQGQEDSSKMIWIGLVAGLIILLWLFW